jgi:hypothetical protein
MSMKTNARPRTPVSAVAPSIDLARRLSRLYERAEESDHIFVSPLGPFHDEVAPRYLPHFVYFGPLTSQDSLRLAVLAGFDSQDQPASRAVLAFIEGLAVRPEIGHALNISFFPIVNLLDDPAGRRLSAEHWGRSREPEIQLLRQDTVVRGYHGFFRIGSTSDDGPSATVRTVHSPAVQATGVELFTSGDFHPWPVRFEAVAVDAVASGPLSVADDLPFAPFEVELAIPAAWSPARTDSALAKVLKRLIVHFRGFQAYGHNL